VKTQAGLLRSRPLFAEVAKRLALRTDADGLMERVTVEPVPDSSIILVRAKAPKAQEAADVANTVAQVYITSTRDSRARNLAKASEQLRANVEAVVRELAAAEVAAKRGPLSADAVVQRTVAEDRLKGLTAALGQVTLAQQNAGDVAKLTEAAAAPKTPAGPSPLSAALAGLLAGALVGALAVSMRHAPPAEAPIAQPPLARSA
jgi:capsular polysaccharide biosynthesis protein